MYILWIIVLITAVLAEAATCALVSVWFALGALAALIAVVLGAGFTLAVTRPVVKKIMPKNTPTNGELDIGKKAIVIEKIDPEAGTGRVRIEGVDWGAKTADSSVIEKGETVVVKAKGAAFVTVAKE